MNWPQNSGRRTVRHTVRNAYLCRFAPPPILQMILPKGELGIMNGKTLGQRFCFAAASLLTLLLSLPAFPAVKTIAVVMSAGSRLQDVQLSELMKLCKGTQKTWVDGKSFTLVMTDPGTPEMHPAIQKLFGMAPADLKAALAKLNESRTLIKIVDSDVDLLRTVEATPGAVGIVDVYSINSSVKVLRVDGKLPFDVGYALKGN
jgi:hypothetical protein